MNYSDYSIFTADLHNPNNSERLKKIWEDLVSRIKEEELKTEAINKGFELVNNEDIEEDVVAIYLKIQVPNASEMLKEYFEQNLFPFIVCLKEED